MKKMINLKDLTIYGESSFIIDAQLDSVPFSLTRLLISVGGAENHPSLSFVSVLRAHPNIEELAFDSSELPNDLTMALKAEEEVPACEILCPHLKRFDGNDEGLRLFLARRGIERGTTIGPGNESINRADLASVWLTPALISSYQNLRILEVWTLDRYTRETRFISTIAPYLTSLTHLLLLDKSSCYHSTDNIVLSLGKLRALESFTMTDLDESNWVTVSDAQAIVGHVLTVFPDIAEIFVGGYESPVYHQYTKGGGLHSSLVSREVACRPYTKWLHESSS